MGCVRVCVWCALYGCAGICVWNSGVGVCVVWMIWVVWVYVKWVGVWVVFVGCMGRLCGCIFVVRLCGWCVFCW